MEVDIFDLSIPFEEKALRVFYYQRENNTVYGRFCKALGVVSPKSINEIPLLPIQAFKEKKVITDSDFISAEKHSTSNIQQLEFRSSGTSSMKRSQHFVADPEIYRTSILLGMKEFYDLEDFVILAYTPGYSSNPHSSLIWMLNTLIEAEKSGLSRFLALNKPMVQQEIDNIEASGKRLMLFGAAFGLLDLMEMSNVSIPVNTIVMETGGMKTFRREMTKSELHKTLALGFDLPLSQIHSEYGMAELLSQAYSLGLERFACAPWMNVSIRNAGNPLEEVAVGAEGLIGVIDLANLYSCSFILTGDKGIMHEDGSFEVLGRWNPQNLRGCNFLIDRD